MPVQESHIETLPHIPTHCPITAEKALISKNGDFASQKHPTIGNTVQKSLGVPQSLKNSKPEGQQGLLMGGGATSPAPRAFSAFQLPCPGMYRDYAKKIRLEVMEGLRYILQTENEYTFAYHGSGTTATTAVMDNLIEVGDKVIVGVYGHWSEIAARIAERLGAKVIRLKKATGSRLSLKEIKEALYEHKPKVLYLFHGESTTGVYQPLEGVGDACAKYGTVLSVDAVATVAQMPINMDALKIDVVVMNTQKAIGGTVGLAPVSFSPKAVAVIRNRKTQPRVYQTDVTEQAREWMIEEPKWHQVESCVHSISLPLLHMLREGLANIVDEGIENVWARHKESYQYLHQQATKLGFEYLVEKEENRLQGHLLLKCPAGKNAFKICDFAWEKHRIEFSTGFGPPTIGKCIRIGLFGVNATIEVAKKVLNALDDAIRSPETDE